MDTQSLESWWAAFTPAEIAAIDADIAKLDALMAKRRRDVLAELDQLESSARSELRAIDQRRSEILARPAPAEAQAVLS